MKAGGGESRRRRRREGRRGQWRGRGGGFILYLDEMVGESTVLVQELLVLQEHGHQDLGRHKTHLYSFPSPKTATHPAPILTVNGQLSEIGMKIPTRPIQLVTIGDWLDQLQSHSTARG